jgi:flagellar biosynthesis anti-sigma factor FlgM
MKIDKSTPQQAITRIGADRPQQAKGAKDAPASRATGQVQFSDASRKLASARGPEVPDEARIERLRGLLAAGKLEIDAGAIADAMMRTERR